MGPGKAGPNATTCMDSQPLYRTLVSPTRHRTAAYRDHGRMVPRNGGAMDLFARQRRESMRLWKHGQGYDSDGLDYIISGRGEHYQRQQEQRNLRKGDRVALLGRGIALVEQIDNKDAVVSFGTGHVLRIPRQKIVFNQHNRRWEYAGR